MNLQPPPGKIESRFGVWMMLVYVQPPLPSDQLNPRIVEYEPLAVLVQAVAHDWSAASTAAWLAEAS